MNHAEIMRKIHQHLCKLRQETHYGTITGDLARGATAGVGALILHGAGYDQYKMKAGPATIAGIVGNVLLGTCIACLRPCLQDLIGDSESLSLLNTIIISVGMTTLGGMLGNTILRSLTKMSVEEIAATMAVGSSTMTGIVLTVLLLWGCASYIENYCSQLFAPSHNRDNASSAIIVVEDLPLSDNISNETQQSSERGNLSIPSTLFAPQNANSQQQNDERLLSPPTSAVAVATYSAHS